MICFLVKKLNEASIEREMGKYKIDEKYCSMPREGIKAFFRNGIQYMGKRKGRWVAI